MGTIIINTLGGAVIGAIGAVVLYLLGFCVELLNCACNIISCNFRGGDAIPGFWTGKSFIAVLMFCVVGGAVIGLVYGIYNAKTESNAKAAKRNEENSERARRQRIQWASEIKQKALSVNSTCDSNCENVDPLTMGVYKADAEMELILSELSKAAELKGKIDAMAEDVRKGGVSK